MYIEIIAIAYESILQSRHGELNQDCLAATAGMVYSSWITFTSHGQLVFGFFFLDPSLSLDC